MSKFNKTQNKESNFIDKQISNANNNKKRGINLVINGKLENKMNGNMKINTIIYNMNKNNQNLNINNSNSNFGKNSKFEYHYAVEQNRALWLTAPPCMQS